MPWNVGLLGDALTKKKGSALTGDEQNEGLSYLQGKGWTGGDINDEWANDILYTAGQRWPGTVPVDNGGHANPVVPIDDGGHAHEIPVPIDPGGKAHPIDDGHAIPWVPPPPTQMPAQPLPPMRQNPDGTISHGGEPIPLPSYGDDARANKVDVQRASLPMSGWWGADDASLASWVGEHYRNPATKTPENIQAWVNYIKEKPGDAGYWDMRMADPGASPTPRNAPIPTPTQPPAQKWATTFNVDPKLTGTGQQALDYLNKIAQQVYGRTLSPSDVEYAKKLIGYQDGVPVTGTQVNNIFDAMDQMWGGKKLPPEAPPVPGGPTPTPTPKPNPSPGPSPNPDPTDVAKNGGGWTPPGDPSPFDSTNVSQMGQDPLSQLLTGYLAEALKNAGGPISGAGKDTWTTLLNIMRNGGRVNELPGVQDTEALSLENARQKADRARRAELSGLKGQLAGRNVLDENDPFGGGAFADTVRRVEQNDIAPMFSQDVRDYMLHAADMQNGRDIEQFRGDQNNLGTALGLASGLAGSEQGNIISAVNAGTGRQGMLSDIALRTLSENNNFNQFIAEYGLKKDQVLAELKNGTNMQLMQLLTQFLTAVSIEQRGQV